MGDLYRRHFGREPGQVRTLFPAPDVVLVLLADSMTMAERRLAGEGRQQELREARLALQHAAAPEFRKIVETAVGRRVRVFTSAHDVDADVASELFVLRD